LYKTAFVVIINFSILSLIKVIHCFQYYVDEAASERTLMSLPNVLIQPAAKWIY